jgi:iron complex outermembrane receptor protein
VDVTPDLENYTIGRYTDSDNNGHVQRLFACNPSTAPTNFLGQLACGQLRKQGQGFFDLSSDMADPYSKLKQWQVINTTTWKATDNLTVKNIISYARLKTKIHADLFGTALVIPQGAFGQVPIPGGGTVPFPFANTPVGFAVIRNIPDSDSSNQATFTEEFRLEGTSFDSKLNWQAGFYYENSTPRAFIGSQSPVFIGCSDPDNLICTDLTGGGGVNYTAAKNSFKTTGVYAQGTYAFTDQLKFTAGARYTWDKVRSISQGVTYTFPVGVPDSPPNLTRCTLPGRTLPLCQVDQKASFHKPTWVLGLDYNPTTDLLLYGKYSRGYRSGGIKSDVPQVFVFFDPEKVDTYEVGAKASFSGAVHGYFNVAGFYNDFSNQQIQLGFNDNPNNPLVVTPTAGPVNIGTSRIWGIEVDSRVTLFDGFSLAAAYSYLNTKVKQVEQATIDPNDPYVLNGFVHAGDRLAFSPKHKINVTAEYQLPIKESLGEITLGATYVHVSNQVSNYSNRNVTGTISFDGVTSVPVYDLGILPSYDVVNFNVNWDNFGGMPVDLAFFVTNAFNEKYFTSVPGLLGSTGFEAGTVAEPRMWGMRLKYRFGAE